jgi:hypothetical protein
MDNQKDIKNTELDSYGHTVVSDNKALINNEIYTFTNKKTEKLVTALYMVTDYMDSDDALKIKLRSSGVELLSDIYKLSNLTLIDKQAGISSSLSHIEEILSFISIASAIGYISEMNTAILKREFMALVDELKSLQSKNKHFSFTLDDKMFEIEKYNPMPLRSDIPQASISNGQAIKRTTFNNMSFISQTKRHLSNVSNVVNKEERLNKIINLIKDLSAQAEKKGLPDGEAGISIKDISISFTDCSEKTIQRELNSLVSKGQIKKIGAKRWSRYQTIQGLNSL